MKQRVGNGMTEEEAKKFCKMVDEKCKEMGLGNMESIVEHGDVGGLIGAKPRQSPDGSWYARILMNGPKPPRFPEDIADYLKSTYNEATDNKYNPKLQRAAGGGTHIKIKWDADSRGIESFER